MKFILLCCPLDNGIRSMLIFNRGVVGASKGPGAVRNALGSVFWERYSEILETSVLPLGEYNLEVSGENLKKKGFIIKQKRATTMAHEIIRKRVERLYARGKMIIGIGGDHSISYPIVKGMADATKKRIGVIYVDSHLDMRTLEKFGENSGIISSGNSFYRLIEDKEISLDGKNVVAIGVHKQNTVEFKKLEEYSKKKGATIFYDVQLKSIKQVSREALRKAGEGTDLIYLSIDMDSVSKRFAPAVSARAKKGLTAIQLYSIVKEIAKSSKVVGMDITEVSLRELSWDEIMGGKKQSEKISERRENLERTAAVAAKCLQYFLDEKGVREDEPKEDAETIEITIEP